MTSTRFLKNITIVGSLILIFMLSGCRSAKSPVTPDYSGTKMTLTQRAEFVIAGYQPWEEINLPVKVAVKEPTKVSVSGRIYMRRDKDIYITLRVLGMEVANMYVNADSVFVTDKLHKYYIAESISDIFAGASLTIGDIQDALLGRAFVNNRGTLSDNLIKDVTIAQEEDNTWTITPRSRINNKIEYQFRFDDSDNSLLSLVFNVAGKLYGCSYSSPVTVDNNRFMEKLEVKATVGKKNIDATLSFDFDKVKWEVPSSARWRLNDSYKRLTPQALIKLFS